VFLVHQDAQQLHYAQSWVGVIQLDAGLLGEIGPVELLPSLLGVRPMPSQDILDGSRDQKVLLLESQLLPSFGRVVGVQHTGDILSPLPGL